MPTWNSPSKPQFQWHYKTATHSNFKGVHCGLEFFEFFLLFFFNFRIQHSKVAIIKPQRKTAEQSLEEVEEAIRGGAIGTAEVGGFLLFYVIYLKK